MTWLTLSTNNDMEALSVGPKALYNIWAGSTLKKSFELKGQLKGFPLQGWTSSVSGLWWWLQESVRIIKCHRFMYAHTPEKAGKNG